MFENNNYIGILGIVTILCVAYLFSSNRKKINFRLVINALLMQFFLAFFILKTHIGKALFLRLASGFRRIYEFASEGSGFVFGRLADPSGPWMMIFAIKVASVIIFFGALMSVLYHLRIIQLLVKIVSFIIRPILGTSGAETLCAAANSMLGQTEAPLLIRNYLDRMTRSEILVVMVSGMATLSGAILAVYGSIGVPMLHLLTASVMAIPGSILISKILLPETETPETMGNKQVEMKSTATNILDAISTGTTDGLGLAVNVLAMLITFISLISLINFLLAYVGFYTLNDIFANIFGPFAYLLGIPKLETEAAGALLGQKLVINEFVAFSNFKDFVISERTKAILTYALAGFSNFSCIGIQIGGIGSLSPKKRDVLVQLGMRALLGGTLTNFLNAAIASLLI